MYALVASLLNEFLKVQLLYRCGMIYIDRSVVNWMSYVKSWVVKITPVMDSSLQIHLLELFAKCIPSGLNFVDTKCTQLVSQVLMIDSEFFHTLLVI